MRKTFLYAAVVSAAAFAAGRCEAQKTERFDFGTGPAAAGYTPVTAVTLYKDGGGYGFDYGSIPVAIDRGGPDSLRRDFCTSAGPLFFSARVPEGTYRVTVTLGDAWHPSVATIKAESRRLMVRKIATKAGQFKTVSFLVSVWDSVIRPGRVVRLKPRERDKLDWDNKLTLEFSNERPCIDAVVITPVKNAITVFLTGNSTVTDQQLEPWSCWGQMIPSFFTPDRVVFADHAASGSTLRASIGRGRLAKVSSLMKPGDYLFVEFAHNDQKKGSGEVAYTSYNRYLRQFIDSARAHGATPVLVTSTNRRSFDSSGHIFNTLGEFPAAMRYEAKKDHVPLIDLNAMTKTLYEAFGPEKSTELFVQFPAGTFPGQDKALADNTHFSGFGAYEIARCVAEGIRRQVPALGKYLKKGLHSFDPARPDDIRNWQLPLTPMFTSVKPYGN